MDMLNVDIQRFPIDANGAPGSSGKIKTVAEPTSRLSKIVTVFTDCLPSLGEAGANGRNSYIAGDGQGAGFINVFVSSSQNAPGGLFVKGLGDWQDWECEIPPGQNLLLRAVGGHGGEGGVGEDGQQGGRGRPGVDATRYSDGGDGHRGGAGGNGGYGTDGGNGGNGGVIEVHVREEDMHILIAVEFDVAGGRGGLKGIHGHGGEGGVGGRGGFSCLWTGGNHHSENSMNNNDDQIPMDCAKHIDHHRPGGRPGPEGYAGLTPSTILLDGQPGLDGEISFLILNRDGTTSRYPSCYDLRVVEGEVDDENCDGVFEPGEHVILRNIVVENIGEMPSPTLSNIPIRILPGPWLNPAVEQEGAWLPTAIPPGTKTNMLGVQKTFVLQEPNRRLNVWEPLVANTTLRVIAMMPGLDRPLPYFVMEQPLIIQYPLVLLPPVYVPTVSLGDTFTVQWKIRNLSSSAHGLHAPTCRTSATKFVVDANFSIIDYKSNHEQLKYIEYIEAGAEVFFQTTLHVSNHAEAFSKGRVTIELLLDEPSHDVRRFSLVSSSEADLRSICQFNINMQISGSYQFNPRSSYLLVVNSDTPGSLIKKIEDYIRDTLRLELDVFNLCATGSLVEGKNTNLLSRYTGKTIIFMCNPFNYFGMCAKSVIESVDPWLLGTLLKSGTNVLLLGASDLLDGSWSKNLLHPEEAAIELTPNDSPVHGLSMKQFLKTLSKDEKSPHVALQAHAVSILVGWAQSRKRAANRRAKDLRHDLINYFPLRRFALTTDVFEGSINGIKTPPQIIVREGLPLVTGLLVSNMPCDKEVTTLSETHKYLVIASLSFEHRMSTFWQLDQTSTTIWEHILLSIKYDLIREISTYCHTAPWHDTATNDLPIQLPTLTKFLISIQNAETWIIAESVDASPLFPIIAWLIAATKTSLFGKAHGRKNTVRHYIWARVASALPANVFNNGEAKIKELVPQIRPKIIDARKGKPIATRAAILAVLAEIAKALNCGNGMHFTGVPFQDLAQELVMDHPTFVWDEDEHAKMLANYAAFSQHIKEEEWRSKTMLESMIVRDGVEKRPEGASIDSAMMGELGVREYSPGRDRERRSSSGSYGERAAQVSPSEWMRRSMSTQEV